MGSVTVCGLVNNSFGSSYLFPQKMETSRVESTDEPALSQKSSLKKEALLLMWGCGKEGFSGEAAVRINAIKIRMLEIFTGKFKTID